MTSLNEAITTSPVRTGGYALINLHQPATTFELTKGRDWCLDGDHRWESIVCTKGSLWLTQTGDSIDHILEEGDAFIITKSGKVIIRALEDSKLGLAPSLKEDMRPLRRVRTYQS